MNEIQLARLFIAYAEKRNEMAFLQKEIEDAVLEIGETQFIAGVTAKYSKPSNETPDYEAAAKNGLPPDITDLSQFNTTTTLFTTRWKEVCEFYKITVPPGAEKPARVVVK
jgi:hypothetical protein